MKDQTPVPLTRDGLARLRLKALRRGLWFKELNLCERVLMELVIKVVDRVRSLILVKLLSPIVKKLLEAMESKVVRMMRTVGCQLAQKLSKIAQGWGNESAIGWVEERGFVQYLAVNYMNTSAMFKV